MNSEKKVLNKIDHLVKKIDLEMVHNCGVSSLSIIDENNYGIGFYNGFIYLKFGGK